MNKLTLALALTVVIGTASGLPTLTVASGTVSVLTLQSQPAVTMLTVPPAQVVSGAIVFALGM